MTVLVAEGLGIAAEGSRGEDVQGGEDGNEEEMSAWNGYADLVYSELRGRGARNLVTTLATRRTRSV